MWKLVHFSEHASQAISSAQEQATALGDNAVKPEHLLLSITSGENYIAARLLNRMGISSQTIHNEISRQIPSNEMTRTVVQLDFRTQRILDFAFDEARLLDSDMLGTEHLLLGLLRDDKGLAGLTLKRLGANLEHARREIRTMPADG